MPGGQVFDMVDPSPGKAQRTAELMALEGRMTNPGSRSEKTYGTWALITLREMRSPKYLHHSSLGQGSHGWTASTLRASKLCTMAPTSSRSFEGVPC